MNKNYLSGRRLEYEMVHEAKKRGLDACRTAGSHGWIDVVIRAPWGSWVTATQFLGELGFHIVSEEYTNERAGCWYTRKGKRKHDYVYAEHYEGVQGVLTLLQCKRRSVVHRANRRTTEQRPVKVKDVAGG